MHRIDFVDEFIKALHGNIPKRPDLVREVARILRIETEPASRRLSRQVNFSVNEVLTLAQVLNISLDSLAREKDDFIWLPSVLDFPWEQETMDSLAEMIEYNFKVFNQISMNPFECETVYSSLPLEYYIHYPELYKLCMFKWAHFFIDPEEYNDYNSWKVPARFESIKHIVQEFHTRNTNISYIWDDSLLFSLVREIGHLNSVGVIDWESKVRIRTELHSMLYDLERQLKNPEENPIRFGNEFYISSIQIGANAFYMKSATQQVAFFSTHFTHTSLFKDIDNCLHIREWISSLKKVSTLISGSGYKERSLFFKDQHEIIDWQLK